MEQITIPKYKFNIIANAVRMAANIHKSRDPTKDQTAFDRMVLHAEQYLNDAYDQASKKRITHEILHKAITKWGREHQIMKIQEEALELALVINQLNCDTKDPEQMEFNLYDELADMKIMLMQADILFDANRINERVLYKLNKLSTKYLSEDPLKEEKE